jgi:hypothetical protein
MTSEPESTARMAAFDRRIGTLHRLGWPVNKSSYLLVMLRGRSLAEEWPLSADYLEQIPPELPGDVPTTLEELEQLQAALIASSASSKV